MKKAIITGPTGAIGIALIKKLISENIEVLAICHRASKRIPLIPKHSLVNIIKCDLDMLWKLKLTEKYDALFHLGWEGTIGPNRNDMYIQNNNIRYTLDAVELAQRSGCSVFIGAGSQAEYGRVNGTEKIAPETCTKPENGYGTAKLCAGTMSRILCKEKEIKHIWCRVLSVYGPFDNENTMIISSVRKLLNGEYPKFTKGEQEWDYLYCDDAANALFLAAQKGKDGAVYCVGSGGTKRLSEYIRAIESYMNLSSPLKLGEIPYSKSQVMYLCADINSLTKDTGFMPAVEFDEGIQKTIEWCKCTQMIYERTY